MNIMVPVVVLILGAFGGGVTLGWHLCFKSNREFIESATNIIRTQQRFVADALNRLKSHSWADYVASRADDGNDTEDFGPRDDGAVVEMMKKEGRLPADYH